MNTGENFLSISHKMFQFYKSLADKSIAVLSEEEIHLLPNGESNNIVMLVKHMSGNMISRFTDFLTSDGEKKWRNRDAEFEDTVATKEEMLQTWEKGWDCVFSALAILTPENLADIVYIRNEGHTVLEALTRQIAHYAYHAGQIVFLAKMIRNTEWQSLSIPRGASQTFNQNKFDKTQERKFFTDEK